MEQNLTYWLLYFISDDCIEYHFNCHPEGDNELSQQLFLEILQQLIPENMGEGTIEVPQESLPKVGFWHTWFFGGEEFEKSPVLYLRFKQKTALLNRLQDEFSAFATQSFITVLTIKTTSAMCFAEYTQLDGRFQFYIKDKTSFPQTLEMLQTVFHHHQIPLTISQLSFR